MLILDSLEPTWHVLFSARQCKLGIIAGKNHANVVFLLRILELGIEEGLCLLPMGVGYLAISAVSTALSFVGLQCWTELSVDKLKSDGLIISENFISLDNANRALELLLDSYATTGMLANFLFNAFILLNLCLKVSLMFWVSHIRYSQSWFPSDQVLISSDASNFIENQTAHSNARNLPLTTWSDLCSIQTKRKLCKIDYFLL